MVECWDAKCLDCGSVHVIRLPDGHGVGETVRFAHQQGGTGCDGYGEHELVAKLTGEVDQ